MKWHDAKSDPPNTTLPVLVCQDLDSLGYPQRPDTHYPPIALAQYINNQDVWLVYGPDNVREEVWFDVEYWAERPRTPSMQRGWRYWVRLIKSLSA